MWGRLQTQREGGLHKQAGPDLGQTTGASAPPELLEKNGMIQYYFGEKDN